MAKLEGAGEPPTLTVFPAGTLTAGEKVTVSVVPLQVLPPEFVYVGLEICSTVIGEPEGTVWLGSISAIASLPLLETLIGYSV
jgi:hypothetical protein